MRKKYYPPSALRQAKIFAEEAVKKRDEPEVIVLNSKTIPILDKIDKIIESFPSVDDISLNEEEYNTLFDSIPDDDKFYCKRMIPYKGRILIKEKKLYNLCTPNGVDKDGNILYEKHKVEENSSLYKRLERMEAILEPIYVGEAVKDEK